MALATRRATLRQLGAALCSNTASMSEMSEALSCCRRMRCCGVSETSADKSCVSYMADRTGRLHEVRDLDARIIGANLRGAMQRGTRRQLPQEVKCGNSAANAAASRAARARLPPRGR